MAIDYNSFSVENEATKNEETFFASAFTNSFKYTDLQALALKIQELLLMEKGTNPAAIEMGVGIKDYLFDFLDETTLSQLTQEVNYQQQKFIPTNLIKRFEFYKNDLDAGGRNKLYIFVHLNNYTNYAVEYFAIDITVNSTNKTKVISNIYL